MSQLSTPHFPGVDGDARTRLLTELKSRPADPYFDPLYKYGNHVLTCRYCDPPTRKLCDHGAALAVEVAEFYRSNQLQA